MVLIIGLSWCQLLADQSGELQGVGCIIAMLMPRWGTRHAATHPVVGDPSESLLSTSCAGSRALA